MTHHLLSFRPPIPAQDSTPVDRRGLRLPAAMERNPTHIVATYLAGTTQRPLTDIDQPGHRAGPARQDNGATAVIMGGARSGLLTVSQPCIGDPRVSAIGGLRKRGTLR